MAKANPYTGTSIYIPEGAPVPDDAPEGARLVGPGAPTEGSEPSSPGTSSSASGGKRRKSAASSSPSRPGPAPTTEPSSNQAPAESSSADSTGGSGPETT